MQKYVNTETKNSLTTFEQLNNPQYWTVEKDYKRIPEQGSRENVDSMRGSGN